MESPGALKDVQSVDSGFIKEIFKAMAYCLFSASYFRLSSFKTENRVDLMSEETSAQASATQELSASIEETASSMQFANENQQMVNAYVAEGKSVLEKAIKKLEFSGKSIAKLETIIEELQECVNRIGYAADVIARITSQTHILSLNASIEAERAGENGKGFAVIAGEVRKLADNTKKSADQIREDLQTLDEGMKKTAEAMEESIKSISEGIEASRDILNPFGKIEESTSEMAELIERLSAVAQEQTAVVEEIASKSTEIAQAAEFADSVASDTEASVELTREVVGKVWEQLFTMAVEKAGLGIFLAQRVVDHANWIDRVISILKGEMGEEADLADHTQCNLGKWYYSQGKDAIKDYSPEAQRLFKEIEEPHRLVHVYGKEAVDKHRDGDRNGTYTAVSNLTEASKKVINKFMQLIDAVNE
ncbi:MAG: hypothetical protein GX088_02770 [Clostridia bacterium]|nr:hypothetical protein [Clostridia bacterium]